MKRLLAISLLLLSLTGCGGAPAQRAGGSASPTVSQVLESGGARNTVQDTAPNMVDAADIPSDAAVDAPAGASAPADGGEGIDVDLTAMSATMVYAEVSNMMYLPDDYVGKTVRMRGQSLSTYYDATDQTYYSVLISDATACCAQGIEYMLAEGAYPADDEEVTVTGEFELYEELGVVYCRLKDAVLTA
ncbi:MAG: hypothetical protein IJ713_06885 [Oscillibacter sp.]|nr:hypothetical protein [Oscillibacter sp.]